MVNKNLRCDSGANRSLTRLPPVACKNFELFPPAGASEAGDSSQQHQAGRRFRNGSDRSVKVGHVHETRGARVNNQRGDGCRRCDAKKSVGRSRRGAGDVSSGSIAENYRSRAGQVIPVDISQIEFSPHGIHRGYKRHRNIVGLKVITRRVVSELVLIDKKKVGGGDLVADRRGATV